MNNICVGLEILFPSPNSLRNDIHVIDNEIAKYFYEVNLYNAEFDDNFVNGMSELSNIIQQFE